MRDSRDNGHSSRPVEVGNGHGAFHSGSSNGETGQSVAAATVARTVSYTVTASSTAHPSTTNTTASSSAGAVSESLSATSLNCPPAISTGTSDPTAAESTNDVSDSILGSPKVHSNKPTVSSSAISNDASRHVLSHFSVLNIQGLKPQSVPSKVPYVEDILKDQNQLFIALTETWLKSHKQAELNIDGYSIFRANRKGRKHTRGRYSGGAAIYLRADIAATTEKLLSYSNGVVEAVVVFSEKENLLICSIYRQPDDSSHNHKSGSYELSQALHAISNAISQLEGTPDILICGDFNMPHANWEAIDREHRSPDGALFDTLSQFQNKHFLSQMINVPTHKSGNTLDLVLTNNRQLINEFSSFPTKFSDHHLIDISSHFKSHFAKVQGQQKTFANTLDSLNFFSEDIDWSAINSELSKVSRKENLVGLDPEDKLAMFLETCEEIMVKHVPKKKVVEISRRSNIPRERRILMRRRKKVVKQLEREASKWK